VTTASAEELEMKMQQLRTSQRPLPAGSAIARPDPWPETLDEAARAALAWMRTGIERSRQRRALALLDERLLRDIGHDRAEVAREIEKPFWRR
jgi:uncharacterized protein YjiS (DUF1127 family)